MRYIELLERRFADRLVKLDQYRHILSTLASNKVTAQRILRAGSFNSQEFAEPASARSASSPCTSSHPYAGPVLTSVSEDRMPYSSSKIPFTTSHDSPMTGQKLPPIKISEVFRQVQDDDADPFAVTNPMLESYHTCSNEKSASISAAHTIEQSSAPSSRWRAALPFFTNSEGRIDSGKVRDVFIEIVEDDYSGEAEDNAALSAKKLFWARMSELNEGTLKFTTYNGIVRINKRKQAKVFGEKLYVHLSREEKCTVTSQMLRDAIAKNFGAHGSSNILRTHDRVEDSRTKGIQDAKQAREDELKILIGEANLLFGMAKDEDGIVTKESIVKGVLQVYKEMKFATSSLYDFGGLQLSLRYVIDVFFWIAMTVVAQCIVKFDLSTVFAPGITLVLVISFALGPFFGNLFLAIGFSFFMLPYDIGDRVMIGQPGPNQITCYITAIDLLQTTVRTIYSEKLIIPNHTLFNEKIINCAESNGASYEIIVHFNFEGPSFCEQEKIDSFIEKIVQFCLVENKNEWRDCWPIASGLDVGANKASYSFWVTHHCSTQQITRVLGARTAFYKKLRSLAREMQISFSSPMIPIYNVPERKSTDEEVIGPPMFINRIFRNDKKNM